MKFRLFNHEPSIGYCQVEEDVYEEREIPEIIGIQLIYEKTLDDRDKIKKIQDYCVFNGIWHISDLIYFDNEEDRIQFILTWS